MGRLGNTNTPLTPPPSELNHHHVHVRVLELVSTVVQVVVPCGAAQGTSVGPFSLVSLSQILIYGTNTFYCSVLRS